MISNATHEALKAFLMSQLVILREHPWIWVLFSGMTGACIASFIGLCTDRLPHTRKWRADYDGRVNLSAPSKCDSCGHRLGFLPLIPILGWLLCRGTCPHCGARVPYRYPLMEAIVAISSGLIASRYGVTSGALTLLCGLWIVTAMAWIDWGEAIIPDDMQLMFFIVGIFASPIPADITERLIGVAMSGGAILMSFAALSLRHRANMFALGDVKMFAATGGWVGFHLMPCFSLAVCVFYLAFHMFFLLTKSRWVSRDESISAELGEFRFVPMGPAIACGFVFTALFPVPV